MKEMHSHWYIMAAIMPLCFIMCMTLAIIQTKALKWYSKTSDENVYSKRTELFCLYGQYIIGGLCAIQCFLCHISNFFPEYYCIYGMSICVIIYAATKSCLYGFFIERFVISFNLYNSEFRSTPNHYSFCIRYCNKRSKCSQGITRLLPNCVWKLLFPLYIAFYFLAYVILCSLTFRGTVVDPTVNKSVPTACLFGQFYPWVFTFSAFIDVFNSILFLFLFMYPMYYVMKKQKSIDKQSPKLKPKTSSSDTIVFNEAIKFNVICSSICSVSSVSFLFVMSFAEHGSIGYYLWLGGNLDIMINSISLFLMLGCNRRYIGFIFSSSKDLNEKAQNVTCTNMSEAVVNGAPIPESGVSKITETGDSSIKMPSKPPSMILCPQTSSVEQSINTFTLEQIEGI